MTKLILITKIFFKLKIFLFLILFSFQALADDKNKIDNLVIIGSENAKIKIKLFSSFTCPHCASFHTEVIPKLSKYVNAGKVQIIFIDFPLDQAAFNASKLLHCVDDNKQMKLLDSIYENQKQWVTGSTIEQINNNLKIIVKSFGLDEIKFNKCVNNDLISDRILNGRIDAHKKYSIESTPTIIINEKKLKGANDFNNIKKQIEKKI